jgi:uncharacterized protein (DUF1778 family)
MKTKTVSLRVEKKTREKWSRAARDSKNLSAFLLSCVNKATRYRRIIEQAEKLERAGFKPSAMEVKI